MPHLVELAPATTSTSGFVMSLSHQKSYTHCSEHQTQKGHTWHLPGQCPQNRPTADPPATHLASQMTTTRAFPPGGMSPLGTGSAACFREMLCSFSPFSASQAQLPGR